MKEEQLTISTDINKLDIKLITSFIANSYWGKGKTIEQTKKSIENSINFGIYIGNKQIGYARVITDFVFFAYLLDVFILEEERGKGYSKVMMNSIVNHPKLVNITSWKLMTADAHKFYEKFGFHTIKNPAHMMERMLNI